LTLLGSFDSIIHQVKNYLLFIHSHLAISLVEKFPKNIFDFKNLKEIFHCKFIIFFKEFTKFSRIFFGCLSKFHNIFPRNHHIWTSVLFSTIIWKTFGTFFFFWTYFSNLVGKICHFFDNVKFRKKKKKKKKKNPVWNFGHSF
jgi:hypothetical protein